MILNHSRLKGPRRSRLASVAGIRQGRVFMQSDAPTTVPIARCEGDLLNLHVDVVREAPQAQRARRVVDSLRDRGVNAHLLRGGVGQFGVRVSLPGGREAEWDTDGTAGLEAQVIRDRMLVGYVPRIEGSEDFDESRTVDAIVRTDYDQPVARQRTDTPAPGPALAREGGVFHRFLDGFRYR